MWSTVISSSLSTGKKNYTTDKKILGDLNRDWHRPFHKRGEGLHPGGRHPLQREVCGRSAFGIVSTTVIWGIPSLSDKEETRHKQKARKSITCCCSFAFRMSRACDHLSYDVFQFLKRVWPLLRLGLVDFPFYW